MRKIAFISFSILIFIGCNESSEKLNSTSVVSEIPAGAVQEPYPNNPELIKVSVYNAANKLIEQGDYLNGLKNGTWTEYHNNGLVKKVSSFVNGKKQGVEIQLSDRGDLQIKAYYHNDQLDGDWYRYKYSRVKEEKFYINGVQHGQSKAYHDNGKVMEEKSFENGVINGVARWYDQEGNKTIEYTYENGKLVDKGD